MKPVAISQRFAIMAGCTAFIASGLLLGSPGPMPARPDGGASAADGSRTAGTDGRSLSYVESSSGLETPQWDGGSTEVEMADVDLDGHVDLLSIGDHGNPYVNTNEHGIMVYFGDGAGNWTVDMNGDFGYGGIAVGDVNDDGLPDVGYAMHHNYSGTDFGDQLIEVALGDGTGLAWTPWDDGLASQGESWGMFATDFGDADNDGDLDLASVSFGFGNPLMVYLNDGDGTWTHASALSGGNPDEIVFFGDINRDGNLDVAASYQDGSVFFGTGDGQFYEAGYNLPAGGFMGLAGLSLGDVDNDGGMDLAFISGGGVAVWAFDEVDSQWIDLSGSLPGSGNYEKTQLCDMDADGLCDVVAGGTGVVTVWTGDGAGHWTQAASYPNGHDANSPFVALRAGGDVDRNGRPDIVHVTEENGIFNARNHLRLYKETSAPAALSIVPAFPKGGEVLPGGSVRFIDWLSAVPGGGPSAVTIGLSTTGPSGPWTPVGGVHPDNGRAQWTVLAGLTSVDCYLRLVVHTVSDSAVALTPRPFTILDGPRNVTLALDPVNPPIVLPPGPGSFDYIVHVANGETAPQSFQAWVMATLPGGAVWGPVVGPVDLTLPAGGTLDRTMTQPVPGGAPPGNYIFRAYVGVYPNFAWSGDGFPVTRE